MLKPTTDLQLPCHLAVPLVNVSAFAPFILQYFLYRLLYPLTASRHANDIFFTSPTSSYNGDQPYYATQSSTLSVIRRCQQLLRPRYLAANRIGSLETLFVHYDCCGEMLMFCCMRIKVIKL